MTFRDVVLLLFLVVAGCLAACNQSDDPSAEREEERPGSGAAVTTSVGQGFEVPMPIGWGEAPLLGHMKWHVAANDGTTNPDCFVLVMEDWSFEETSLDDYIATQTEEHFVEAASVMMSDVVVVVREEDFNLGGQRAIHIVYSATVDGIPQASFSTQTIRSGKLYHFGCNAMVDGFGLVYPFLLEIQDSFKFVDAE